MRKLSELIVLVRGGGEEGSAIAHRLFHSHFRVCITETSSPLEVNRGTCFSEAVYDHIKTIEGVTGERTLPSVEQIYHVWREGNVPILVDPELSARYLVQPDVLINAMMLKRETSTRKTDAPLVIGVGPGFTAGVDVHMLVETDSRYPGKVILEGKSTEDVIKPSETGSPADMRIIRATEAGIFMAERSLCDAVQAGDIIGKLGETPLNAPVSGIVRGIVRDETKVLANAKLAEIDPANDKSVCFTIRDTMRSISGGVLEAIMYALNQSETS
jgi:xanthine dehydrogenase accessory factor